MSVPNYTSQEQVEWIRKKISDRDAITMSEYATTFDYFTKDDAEMDFSTLLTKSFIPRRLRTSVYSKYEIWKCNEGDNFWASRVMKISKTRTDGELVAESVDVKKDFILDTSNQSPVTPLPGNQAGYEVGCNYLMYGLASSVH
jgi:hypothetical protein